MNGKYQKTLNELECLKQELKEACEKNKKLELEKNDLFTKLENEGRLKNKDDLIQIEKLKRQLNLEIEKVRDEADKSLAELKGLFNKVDEIMI